METAATEKTKARVLEMEAASEKTKATALEMKAASEKMKATSLEMEAATEKIKSSVLGMEAATKSSVLDIEAAPKNMPIIFVVDVILYIFRFLDIEDRIAFALSCQRFKRLCIDEMVFRKLDLSRSMISISQREVMKRLFRDRQLIEHIRELNISNFRFLNWQMDNHLEKFVVSICPHLETLHVLDCGVSLRTLHRILQEAPQLTSLSWSIWDFTSEDIYFVVKGMKSHEGLRLKNIKHLHLEMNQSLSHLQIAKYLVLSCCRDIEEVEIYTWQVDKEYCSGGSFPLVPEQSIPGFRQPSVENELQQLHSLVVVAMGALYYDTRNFSETYRKVLYEFVISLLSRKSSSTKWKKFCLVPSIGFIREDLSLFRKDDIQLVEAIGADLCMSGVNELKTLFERIGDNTVRSLNLCLERNIVEICKTISRVGGHSLKFLRLSVDYIISYSIKIIRAEQNVLIHSFFSNCPNITELGLLHCSFEKDICEPLSELKHLTKVQLKQCAISSKYSNENQVEISKANLLTFVEKCKNITHLDVRSCYHEDFSCHLTDDDLLALAMFRNLKSLTLCYIDGIREWTFLKNISEHCRFLTTLRIFAGEDFNNSHIPVLMESSRFLKHLAINVRVPLLGSEVFWNLLSHVKNLERLCITSNYKDSLHVPVAVETITSLPRLHVLHLHDYNVENADDFYDQMIRMLEENKSDYRFSFEIITENRNNKSDYKRDTWINHPTGYSLISNKVLPLNEAELCKMRPVLDIPMI